MMKMGFCLNNLYKYDGGIKFKYNKLCIKMPNEIINDPYIFEDDIITMMIRESEFITIYKQFMRNHKINNLLDNEEE